MASRALRPSRGTPEPLGAPEITPQKVEAGIRAFFRIMEAWGVDNETARILLGRPSRATYFHWKKGLVRGVPHDTVRRISWILGIYKALHVLFRTPERADGWIRRENGLLGGQSALARMRAGDVTDLAAVRTLLDTARGGGV